MCLGSESSGKGTLESSRGQCLETPGKKKRTTRKDCPPLTSQGSESRPETVGFDLR